jgi:hypothetical protein
MGLKTPRKPKESARSAESLSELLRITRGRDQNPRQLVLRDQEFQGTLDENELVVLILGKHHAIGQSIKRPDGSVNLRDLRLSVKGAALAVEQLGPRQPGLEAVEISEHEQQLLREGGFEAPSADATRASEEGQLEYLALLSDSLSPDEAAKLLRVNSSRVRQRLGERQLFGIKDRGTWRLPRFQFAGGRLVPGIQLVLPTLPETLHPVAVQRWFRIPHPDLELDDGTTLTPLEWLGKGHEPNRVAELAALL